jgi:hypothetical protein
MEKFSLDRYITLVCHQKIAVSVPSAYPFLPKLELQKCGEYQALSSIYVQSPCSAIDAL